MGYRGNRPGGRRWLVLLLVLLILAAAGFLIAQHYLVYRVDGSYHFELPFLPTAQKETALPGSSPHPQVELVIEEPPPAEVAAQELRSAELDPSVLQGGMVRALEELPENVNAVALRLKTVKGELLYPSALSEAVEAKAVAGSSIALGELDTLLGSDYYTIARLSMLHDSIYSRAHMTDAAILQKTYKNNIWYANDSSFYLAPEKELARTYLTDIAAEVAAMGFDELLLDCFGYPGSGRLSNIETKDRTMTMADALSLLAAQLREATEESGVRLSVVLDENTVLGGGNEKTGQDLATLASIFDRVYVPTTQDRLPDLRAALAPYTAELVPILEAPAEEAPYLVGDRKTIN